MFFLCFFVGFFSGAGKDQKARAGREAEEGSGEVWKVDMKEGGGEGATGRRRRQRAGEDGEGSTRRGRWGRTKREGGERGGQAHRMPGWNKVTVFL